MRKENLKRIWHDLDMACGLLDNTVSNMSEADLPDSITNELNVQTIFKLICIKNQIEKLILDIK